MKLAILNSSRVWGGNEKWLATLAHGLVNLGHAVVVACPDGEVRTELRSRNITTSGHRPRGALDPVSAADFALWLARERPDALLITSWRATAWATFAAQAARVPRIVVRLGIVRTCPQQGPVAAAFRRTDAMIVNSPEIRDEWLRTAAGFPASRVHVVMNGVESRLKQREELRTRLREEIHAQGDTFIVGGAGHLAARKGFDLLIRAFADAAIPGSALVIAGDGDARPELEALAASLLPQSRVHWLGRRPNAADLIAGMDAFVLSSSNEGMANVMLEAMAGGTPAIAFDISGVRTALGPEGERGPAGWIVPSGDVGRLAETIHTVARLSQSGDDSLAGRVQEAHWRVANRFSAEEMVRRCERILFDPAT